VNQHDLCIIFDSTGYLQKKKKKEERG